MVRCALLPKRPAGHEIGNEAPSRQKPPLPHGWHASTSTPPFAELNRPAGHACSVLFVLASGQKCPLAHEPEHCAELSFCSEPNVPDGQNAGSAAPLTQKWAIGQGWHWSGDPSALLLPNVPAAHGSGVVAPLAQKEPIMQPRHAVAPLAFMNVPGAHCAQLPMPGADACDPAEHGTCATAPVAHALPGGHGRHDDAFPLPAAAE